MAVLASAASAGCLFFPGSQGACGQYEGLVFVCYLSARHQQSQVTATPQPISVIATTFSHFPDNSLHLHAPICPPPSLVKISFLFSFYRLPSSFTLFLTLLYFSLQFYSAQESVSSLFLFSLRSHFPHTLSALPLSPPLSPALSSHQKVLDFDICLQEQWPMK